MDPATRHSKRAKEARKSGNPLAAGEYLTAKAYSHLGERPARDNRHGVYRAERAFTEAILCYRLGDKPDRAKNRSQQGELISEDTIDLWTDHYDPPGLYLWQGALHEYVGDLKVAANRESARDSYAAARSCYDNAGECVSGGDWTLIDTGEMNDYSMGLFNDLISLTGADIEKVSGLDDEMTHQEWVEYKQRQLPGLVEALLECGIEVYSEN